MLKRVQSGGVGLPTDASVARRAVRIGALTIAGLARSRGLVTQSPEPERCCPVTQSPERLL
eukprot:6796482-Pyramimonas_sp.AAC.1